MGTTLTAVAARRARTARTARRRQRRRLARLPAPRRRARRSSPRTTASSSELVRDGQLTPEEAAVHPQRTIVTRALGIDPDVEVDCYPLVPYTRRPLSCCAPTASPTRSTTTQIASALRRLSRPARGGRRARRAWPTSRRRSDNITVVVVDVVDDDGRAEAASAAAGERLRRPTPATHTAVTEDAHSRRGRPAAPPPSRAAPVDRAPALHLAGRAVRAARRSVVLIARRRVGAVGWYARHTYYVGFDGRPGRRSTRAGPAACCGSTRRWTKRTRARRTRRARRAAAAISSRRSTQSTLETPTAVRDQPRQETTPTTQRRPPRPRRATRDHHDVASP